MQVLVDSKLASSTELLAFHPSDSSKTVFITHEQLKHYLESTGVKVTEVEFGLATVAGTPLGKPEAKKAAMRPAKEDAKIEGAALIGIDVRKELDFPNWYQQVLTKGDMLDYYDVSGCYIMKPWSYSVWEVIQRIAPRFLQNSASDWF